MELFQANKNVLFQAIVDMVNDMVKKDRKYSDKEIKTYLNGVICGKCAQEVKGSMDDKIEDLLADGTLSDIEKNMYTSLIKKNNENLYEPKIKKEIPYIPTKVERYVLAELIEDTIAQKLLSQDTIATISNLLDEKADSERYLYKNQRDTSKQYEEQKNLYEALYTIMQAMIQEKMIQYDNQMNNDLSKGKIGTPYKFVYSARFNGIQLIIKPQKENRCATINVEEMNNIKILDIEAEKNLNKWFEEQSRKFTIKIIKKENYTEERRVNVVERCFSLFSHLDKEAIYDDKEDTHTIKVTYYVFDEEDIIRDILSMGSDVVVLEPQYLREKIIEHII